MPDSYPFVNTPLPYAYDALEPYIDEKTMHLHHDKHLQSYIDHLNETLRTQPRLQHMTLEQLICIAPRLPPRLATAVSRNAGGVYNHRFYFAGMAPGVKGARPKGELAAAIETAFVSFEAFEEKLTAAAQSVFGSGYAWLAANRRCGLSIVTTANQETPLTLGLCPILNIDVWEHAYYLKHYNKRDGYLADWWNVVNWEEAERRFAACKSRRNIRMPNA